MLEGEVYIGLQTATIPPITNMNVVDCWIFQEILLVVMGELYIVSRLATIPPKDDIARVMVQDIELVINISNTLHC